MSDLMDEYSFEPPPAPILTPAEAQESLEQPTAIVISDPDDTGTPEVIELSPVAYEGEARDWASDDDLLFQARRERDEETRNPVFRDPVEQPGFEPPMAEGA